MPTIEQVATFPIKDWANLDRGYGPSVEPGYDELRTAIKYAIIGAVKNVRKLEVAEIDDIDELPKEEKKILRLALIDVLLEMAQWEREPLMTEILAWLDV
jgi:hypothetical protein